MTYTVRPLDETTWDAFAELVERNNGVYGGCWCIAFHTAYQRGVSDPRTLKEELKFDRSRVTSLDWASYPILTFPDVPKLDIDLIDRPTERPLGAGEAASAPVASATAAGALQARTASSMNSAEMSIGT